MSRPKYLYPVEKGELIVHSNNTGAITVQQAPLHGGSGKDNMIHLSRENAAGVRDALDQWLKDTE